MGSFPTKSSGSHGHTYRGERTSLLSTHTVRYQDDSRALVAREAKTYGTPPMPDHSLDVEEAMQSQTLRPDVAHMDLSHSSSCSDADNPIRRPPCRCPSLSLDCPAPVAVDGCERPSLPRILCTPGSAGLTSAGTESLPTSVQPHAPLTARRGYIGDEIHLVTPGDMDDFALASIGDPAAVLGDPSSSAWNGVSLAAGSSERAAADSKDLSERVVDFVSFRRPGIRWCGKCQGELPQRANFCPQCGFPASAVSDECITGPFPLKESHSGTSVSPASSQELNGYVVSFNATPVTPWLEAPLALKHTNSSGVSPMTPYSARGGANAAAQVSFKDDAPSLRTYRARAYRRRVRMDLSARGLLGRGAAGAVYKALDIRNGQQMAVKVMDLKTTDAEDIVSIRNELRHLARLRHANIVEYFGCRVEEQILSPTTCADVDRSSPFFSQEDEDLISLVPSSSSPRCNTPHPVEHGMRVFILMERLECGTLAETLRMFPGGLPVSTVQVYAVQLVAVVLHVHQCGLTHRDIKPANVLLASDGTIKVADFGCATVHAVCGFPTAAVAMGDSDIDGDQVLAPLPLHADKKMAGTPAYMPPETASLLAERSHDTVQMALYHRAQDVWGLGCTVHQLLTGEDPWESLGPVATPFALLMKIQGQPFPISPAVTGAARDFLDLCFALDPKTRVDNSAHLSNHPFLADM